MLYDQKWELDEASKTLLAAADYIEEHGWCQGRLQDGERMCAMEAIFRAAGGFRAGGGQWNLQAAAINKLGIARVPDWNDNPARTKEQVVARLRAAAFAHQ